MSRTQKRLDELAKVKSEINFYMDASEGASTDNIEVYSQKIDILQDIAFLVKDYKITDENSESFDKIFKLVDAIREIKGLSPLVLIFAKLGILRKNIEFLYEINTES